MNELNKAFLEGAAHAKLDNSTIEDCPHKILELKYAWKEGFEIVKPNGKTSIERVLTSAFGGPPRRDDIEELPFGDWVKPENYLLLEDEPDWHFEPKKKGESSEYNHVFQSHLISDGAYDVTDIPFFHIKRAEGLDDKITDEGLAFVKEHGAENIFVANGYQVLGIFLFAGKPKPYNDVIGNYGRGACAIMQNCPKSILIVAEDD
jgi:hypothetical protein